jgi:hypothetical protein
MTKYLVVAAWDEDNVVIAETRAETEERAIELQAIMVSEGHSEAFYVDMPSGDIGPFVVDPEAKTVIRDADIGNAELLASNWKYSMMATDKDVPRSAEDIYDALQADAQARVPQITRDKIAAKKTLRGEKP